VAGVCGALLFLSIGFMAYRPSGGIYFAVAAGFVPALVDVNLSLSLALLAAIAALFGLEWCLFYLDGAHGERFPLFVVVGVFLAGIGMIVVAGQRRDEEGSQRARERERIARDLRDVLGHSLSSLALKAELARRVFHSDPARALLEISDVERIARQGLEEMRAAVTGYFAGDIHAELDRVESLLKAAGIRVERRCEALEMPPANERVLALIVREAVTNILRHSQARACHLALFRAGRTYRLEITDDGRGGGHEEGVGMRSIRTRAEMLGGTAVWSATPGTQLCVSLPVPAGGHE
jgi:two-component system sensor histidine kinase DesK